MVVKVGKVNSAVKSLGGGGGGGGAVEGKALASKMGFLGSLTHNEIGADDIFQALTSIGAPGIGMLGIGAVKMLPEIAKYVEKFKNDDPVKDKETEINALEGHKDEVGTGVADPNLEVVMGGAPEAINYILTLLAGDDLAKNAKLLKDQIKMPTSGQPETQKSIEETDERLIQPQGEGLFRDFAPLDNKVLGDRLGMPLPGGELNLGQLKTSLSAIGGGALKLQGLMDSFKKSKKDKVPPLTGKLLDDLILYLDVFITDLLNELLGFNLTDRVIRYKLLKAIAQRKLDDAAEIILENTTRTDLTKDLILEKLSVISIDAGVIVDTGEYKPKSEISIGGNNIGTFIDTAEEFEADLAGMSKAVQGLILHSSGKADPRGLMDLNSILKEVGGGAFNYIMMPNGRVFRGSSTPTDIINMLFVKANDNPNNPLSMDQYKSFREILRAVDRVIPGIKVGNYSEINPGSNAPTVGVNPRQILSGIQGTKDTGVQGGYGDLNTGITPDSPPAPAGNSASPLSLQGELKHALDPKCGAVNSHLRKAGDATGIRVVVSSGYRGSGGSGRHNGRASDCYLEKDGAQLHHYRLEDRKWIQAFTEEFIKSAGAKFGVGIANTDAPKGIWYMHGTHYHYDVVGSKYNRGRGDYWGNGSSKRTKGGKPGAPAWLASLARKYGA